ncbi:SAM-dependent methyltransferase [Streptomyces sp. NPDC092903]|uniref:SAM-dependent methyltransferase n=1 Tax=Streptomyces sp. NPDC092903 TaxID=3366017 RepID=UPI00380F9BAA
MSTEAAAYDTSATATAEGAMGSADWAGSANSARLTNLALGGIDNYAADHVLARRLNDAAPYFAGTLRINAVYNHLTVALLAADLGIRGFLDLGPGLPTLPRSRTYPDTRTSAHGAAAGHPRRHRSPRGR